ncbi:MAG: hypothetical protein JO197_07920 [Acidobacteria bacterium]|nr:hypothetical protein [Acidobacteriota bacterium]MBV9475909.1 hypothetical protein [Acidobacteriota bacterium]
MTTLFVVCFIAGLGLSVVSFVSGLEHVNVFDRVFAHRALHLHPHAHGGRRASMVNAAAITAFLTWFGGGGLLIERLTPWSPRLIATGAIVIGAVGASVINSVIGRLARDEAVAAPLSMLGVVARTTIPIRAVDGTGEIVFRHAGTRRVCGARSDDGRAIAKGTEVIVTRYEKGIAYVTTWDELAPANGALKALE